MIDTAEPILDIRRLRVAFATETGLLRAVDGVDLHIARGETVALVGESGCGKSQTALATLGLVTTPPGVVRADRIRFDGQDLIGMTAAELNRLRGDRLAMIFQEPTSSLNPVFPVGDQIAEVLENHRGLSRQAARQQAVGLLDLVGVPAPAMRAHDYPHQLSGGLCQRVMIAMALACRPALLIADEPTTALDVTIQAQILETLATIQGELGMALLLITHDLGIVAEMTRRVYVMYAGQIVEDAPVERIFSAPAHPYTRGLLASIPRMTGDRSDLRPIPGVVPHLSQRPSGCRFHPRCAEADDECAARTPPLIGDGAQAVRCWHHAPRGGATL